MLLLTVNSLFALAFAAGTRFAWKRARLFLRTGWIAIDAQMQHDDYRHNVERRRAIAEGGRYLIGGGGWLVICIVAAGYTLFFVSETIQLLF